MKISEELFNFILTQVLLINNIDTKDESYEKTVKLLTLYINQMVDTICIKTNRNQFPEDLKYLAIDLTNNMYDLYLGNKSQTTQNIQSMSENGRSVNFGVDENTRAKFQLILQNQLEENNKLINRYKLLYKTGCVRDGKN